MKNKAFTLVELLGVIVLLGILGVVIIPKVGDSIENSKEQSYKVQEETIKKAANDFLIDNTEFLEENDTITIKLGVLKQKGYLPVNIKNPKTRKNISNESLITITKNGNAYKIELALVDLENVTENIDNNSPILVLNGDYIEYVEVNDLYEEKGAIAKTSTGETIDNVSRQIKLNNVEKSIIDTSQLLTYNVIYSATDTNGKTTSATRTVIVRDTTSPTITFPSETTIHTSEVAAFNIMQGVSATDNYSTTPTITVNSSLAKLPGKYVITYIAKDSSNNETTERRVINVEDTFEKYYATLEYLESTGTQYIMTDIVPSNDMGVMLKVSSADINNDLLYLGSKGSGNTRFWIGNYNNTVYYGWNTNTHRNNNVNEINIIKMNYLNDRKSIYNDEVVKDIGTEQLGSANTYPITIFAGNNAGTVSYKSKIRLYELKVSKGSEIKYNFVPCMRKSDGKLGLYDLVNNKFYENSGTGTFGYKMQNENPYERLYTKLEYIESTGTQYIDTGVIATNNTVVKAELFTNYSENKNWFGGSAYSSNNNFVFNSWSQNQIEYQYGASDNWYKPNVGDDVVGKKFTVEYGNGSIKINNDKKVDLPTNSFTDTKSIHLFVRNGGSGNISGRIYSLKIYNGDLLIRDFVPAVRNSDNKPGLYDEVNDVFYTNSGTGEFTKGNPVN
ncbi:MAG: immunoglobulin-like domain-containing protein [Bacilli bacterium]